MKNKRIHGILLFCCAVLLGAIVVSDKFAQQNKSNGKQTKFEHATLKLRSKVMIAKMDCQSAINNFLVEEERLEPAMATIAGIFIECREYNNLLINKQKKYCHYEKEKELRILLRGLKKSMYLAQASIAKFDTEIKKVAGEHILDYGTIGGEKDTLIKKMYEFVYRDATFKKACKRILSLDETQLNRFFETAGRITQKKLPVAYKNEF